MGDARRRTAFATCGVLLSVMAAATVQADPQFPDLSAFNAVDNGPYELHGINLDQINFSTPDALNCSFNAAAAMKDPTTNQGLSCRGKFPGVDTAPPNNGYCEDKYVRNNAAFVYRFESSWVMCDSPDQLAKPLASGSKIASGNITCMVGDGRLTACLDTRAGQRHGFVLQPSGSSAF